MGMIAYLKRVPGSVIPRCSVDAAFAKEYISGIQPDTETINVKESWDGLHYLFSSNRRRPAKVWDTLVVWDTSDLMGISVLGKEILNKDCKLGFGNPKWIDAEQVKDIAELLKDLEWEVLEEKMIPDRMRECGVYPEELWEDEEKAAKYLRYWFSQLIKFYERAASCDQAVICYLKI